MSLNPVYPTDSISQKIKNNAKKHGVNSQSMLAQFALERFLYLLSKSQWRDKFCLKGGLLLSSFDSSQPLRPTTDIDLSGANEDVVMPLQAFSEIVAEICSKADETRDGVRFDLDTVTIKKDRSQGRIQGGKLKMLAYIGRSCVPIEIDVGFGNPIRPGVRTITLPTLLPADFPQPCITAYPVETIIAEKLHAIYRHGLANSRHKDYYDIWFLSSVSDIDSEALLEAIKATFGFAGHDIPSENDLPGLSDAFRLATEDQWSAFLSKNDLSCAPRADIFQRIRDLLLPVLEAEKGDSVLPGSWLHDEASWSNRTSNQEHHSSSVSP